MADVAAISASSALSPTASAASDRVTLNRLLAVGIAIRVGIFLFASPFNADDHLGVVDWIVRQHALPVSNALQQSYHPPLYYLLAAPIRAIAPAATWPLHLVSLVLSCLNLVLLRRLMDDPIVAATCASAAGRAAIFALVATLAQFAMFGSFISNDPLAFLIGTLLFADVLKLIRMPSGRCVARISVWLALGLLTKGTFLLVGLALLPVLGRRVGWRRALAAVLLAFVIGSFKYVDNVVRVGRPIVHNQEMPAFANKPDRTIWRGPSTIYDVNVATLVRHPVVRVGAPTSYPLTLYASFWYAHLADSSFHGNVSGYDWVGRATYVVATAPTILFLLGLGIAVARLPRWWRRGDPADAALVAATTLFVANLAVVVGAGVRFDVWEAFQGRLLFQSLGPMLLLALAGAGKLPASRPLRGTLIAMCWATVACALLYFVIEFALAKHLLAVDETLLHEIGVQRR